MKKLRLFVLLVIGFSAVVVSCKDDDDSTSTPTPVNNNPILTNKAWEIDSTLMIVNTLNSDTIDSTYRVTPVNVSGWNLNFNSDGTGNTLGTAFGDNSFNWNFSNQQSIVTLDFTLPDTSFSQFYILTVNDSTLSGTVSSVEILVQNGATIDTAFGDLIEFWKRQD